MAPASLLRKGMAAGKPEIRCALVTTSSCRLTFPMVGCGKSAKTTPKTPEDHFREASKSEFWHDSFFLIRQLEQKPSQCVWILGTSS